MSPDPLNAVHYKTSLYRLLLALFLFALGVVAFVFPFIQATPTKAGNIVYLYVAGVIFVIGAGVVFKRSFHTPFCKNCNKRLQYFNRDYSFEDEKHVIEFAGTLSSSLIAKISALEGYDYSDYLNLEIYFCPSCKKVGTLKIEKIVGGKIRDVLIPEKIVQNFDARLF